jgi:hypothetical protein
VEQPIGNLDELGESAILEVPWGAFRGAGEGVASQALSAMTTGMRVLFRYHPVTYRPTADIPADLHDLPSEFVTDDHRGCIGMLIFLDF